MRRLLFLFSITLLLTLNSFGQRRGHYFLVGRQYIKDTVVGISMLGPSGCLQFPAGEMARRWGSNWAVGASFWRKTSENWIFSFEYNYIFGEHLRENHVLDSITLYVDNTPVFINGDGQLESVQINERGHLAFGKVGKVLPFFQPNPNCGFIVRGGLGYMEHHISYYWGAATNTPPQLAGDYIKGYDRLTNGIAFSQSTGFFFLDPMNHFNFSGEFEIIEGLTKNRRYNFDLRGMDTHLRLDILYGLKLHFFLPLYGKNGGDKYY